KPQRDRSAYSTAASRYNCYFALEFHSVVSCFQFFIGAYHSRSAKPAVATGNSSHEEGGGLPGNFISRFQVTKSVSEDRQGFRIHRHALRPRASKRFPRHSLVTCFVACGWQF